MGRHGENIRKRKDGRWEGRYKVFDESRGRNIYRSVYGRAYGEVKEKLAKAKAGFTCKGTEKQKPNLAGSQEKDTGSGAMVLFSQAAGEWLEEVARKRKYSTYMKYGTVYKAHLSEKVGSWQLSAATVQEFQEKLFEALSGGALSESLQKSICCIANQILNFANKRYSLRLPLLERPAVRTQKKAAWTLSRAEQARLLHYIDQGPDKFKTAVLLCLYTGLRLGELCSLKWADIDIEGMALTVNRTVQRIAMQGHKTKTILMETDPKSESSRRTIPLTAEMVGLLAQLKGCQPYVFGGEKPLDPRTMQYQFKRILKASGIDGRNFHLLRHTFATNCIENNMDVKTLSEILGHSDVKITLNRYVHPTMDAKRKQVGMLPGFYGQIRGQAA